jgi:hypothetical protein
MEVANSNSRSAKKATLGIGESDGMPNNWIAPSDPVPISLSNHIKSNITGAIGSSKDVYIRLQRISVLLFGGNPIPVGRGMIEVDLTPALARELRKLNIGINRPVTASRQKTISSYLMNWNPTQAIVLSISGLLIDGNGRVTTIAGRPDGESYKVDVAYGRLTQDFIYFDRGKSRTSAESNNVNKELLSVASYLASYAHDTAARNLSDEVKMDYVSLIDADFNSMMGVYSNRRPTWGTDPVRAAAIYLVRILGEDPNYVFGQYRAISLNEQDGMAKIVHTMKGMWDSGHADFRIVSKTDKKVLNVEQVKARLFLMAIKAFSPKTTAEHIVRGYDTNEIREAVRGNVLAAEQSIRQEREQAYALN